LDVNLQVLDKDPKTKWRMCLRAVFQFNLLVIVQAS